MKKNKEEYRMPNGKWTNNAVKMANAWKKIYTPICKELGMNVIGFDPGIRFTYGNYSFDLPIDLAIKINKLIRQNKDFASVIRKNVRIA